MLKLDFLTIEAFKKNFRTPFSGFSVCGTKCGQGNFDYGEINSKAFHYDPKAGWIPNNSGEF